MMVASEDSTPVYDFRICSPQMLSTDSSVQYPLHKAQNTTVRFAFIVDDLHFNVQVTFQPFHRESCSFTYHDYKLQCLFPPGLTESVFLQSQNSAITIAQRLYDRHFLQHARYPFRFSEQDLIFSVTGKQRESKQPNRLEIPSNGLRWIAPVIRNDEPPAKRQKCASINVTIREVQVAYEKARHDGRLQSPFVPRSGPDKTSSMERWDPYIIPESKVHLALLDEEKLESLRSDIKTITRRIPLATKWTSVTQARGLTPADLRTVIQTAIGSLPAQPRLLLDNNVSPILAIGSIFLRHADGMELQQREILRGTLLARLIGFSVMRVYEATAQEDSGKVYEAMQNCYPGQACWQKQSRNLACYWGWMIAQLPRWKGREVALYLLLTEGNGEQTLRQLFKRSLPAVVGELATILNSETYSEGLSDSASLPSIIALVKCLVGAYVDDTSICRALGYPDSYLDGSASDWLERLEADQGYILAPCPKIIKRSSTSGLTKPSGAYEERRSTERALAGTADEVRLEGGEVGEQLCDVDKSSERVLPQAPPSAGVPEHLIPVRSAPPVMDSPEILRATIESNMTPVHGFNDEYFREIWQDLDDFQYAFDINYVPQDLDLQEHDVDSQGQNFLLQL